MAEPGSISQWLDDLKLGKLAAAQPLWERFFQKLVALARARLGNSPRWLADSEDVALDAFDSFCRGVVKARFPDLSGRDDLWKLLIRITACKAADLVQFHHRLKRAGGAVGAPLKRAPEWEEIISTEPTPEYAAQIAEEYQRLLDRLGDDTLRTIAIAKFEGYTSSEIADHLNCTERTVERKLKVIRSIWLTEVS